MADKSSFRSILKYHYLIPFIALAPYTTFVFKRPDLNLSSTIAMLIYYPITGLFATAFFYFPNQLFPMKPRTSWMDNLSYLMLLVSTFFALLGFPIIFLFSTLIRPEIIPASLLSFFGFLILICWSLLFAIRAILKFHLWNDRYKTLLEERKESVNA